jgi:hypothetical protein
MAGATMQLVITVLLVGVGILHLIPAAGIAGVASLGRLYDTTIASPELEILMRHRAALFGIIGGLLTVSGFLPRLQAAALTAGFISIVSFLWIARAVGDYGPAIARVVAADVIALAALAIAAGSKIYVCRQSGGSVLL